MKGFLSFLIIWLVRNEAKTGAEITEELERRRGHRPSPGTIYPVLKELKDMGLLDMDGEKRYSLTKMGEEALEEHLDKFFSTFCDIDEMREHCKCHGQGGHHGNWDHDSKTQEECSKEKCDH
jgi:DNA-binding PadR family transcriptional regulator